MRHIYSLRERFPLSDTNFWRMYYYNLCQKNLLYNE